MAKKDSVIKEYKQHHKDAINSIITVNLDLQAANFHALKPLVAIRINELIDEIKLMDFTDDSTDLVSYVKFIIRFYKLNDQIKEINEIFDNIDITTAVNSSFMDNDRFVKIINMSVDNYIKFKQFHSMNYLFDFVPEHITGKITEQEMIDIINIDNIYFVYPIISLLLKECKTTNNIIPVIESMKNKIIQQDFNIDVSDMKNVVQRMVQFSQLVQGTPPMPLDKLFSLIGIHSKDLKDLSKHKTFGFVFIHKILPKPVIVNMWSLYDKQTILNAGYLQDKNEGINKKSIQRFNTIRVLEKADGEDGIIIYGYRQNNYYIETLDGNEFYILKNPHSNDLFVENTKLEPSARTIYYNNILNREIFKDIRQPYISLNSVNKSVANKYKHIIKRTLIEDLEAAKKNKKKTMNFIETYDYTKLITSTIDAVISNIPNNYIAPLIDYEFKSLFNDQLTKFDKKIKETIIIKIKNSLTQNPDLSIEDSAVMERIIDETLEKMLVSDRNNIMTSLVNRITLLSDLIL
jgi:hypothetical protein